MSYSFDLRAPSISQKRSGTRSDKYYHFRHVKPGQLKRPHYRLIPTTGKIVYEAPISDDTPIEIWNKKRMYIEAHQWPRPPKYHHAHIDKLHKQGMTQAYARRRSKAGQLRRLLESWETLDDSLLGYEELGEKHFQSARSCSFCQMVVEIRNERENAYEAQAEEEERDAKEIFSQHGESAAGSLLEIEINKMEMTKMEMEMSQLDMDGWSVCGSEGSIWSDEDWDVELT
jgi:hypothetical protein